MQSKFEKLPPELKTETAQKLSNRELAYFSMTSKYHLAFFKPLVDVPKLLHHVVRGMHDAVELILKDDVSLIFKRGFVTDYSSREFESVSAFEYALWALDKHMWARMIACIPQNEKRESVFAQLIAQYNKLDSDGVTYRLNGKTITEQHFDFENSIIKELQTQVDLINGPPAFKNYEEINRQWREGVGGAQKRLPMHVVDEYCSSEPFFPVPEFTSQPGASKRFFHWITENDEHWFDVGSKLSVDFAIYKSYLKAGEWASRRVIARAGATSCGAAADDLEAMTVLCQVRTADFIALKSQLEDQMKRDNHHQVSSSLPH